MSWVDGQAVAEWAAEIAKREQAIDGYLNDADPEHAEKYGFRSGQNPRLAWSWFRDNPVGFNGVPFVLFKTILDLDPEPRESGAASDRANLEARGGRAGWIGPAAWTLDHIGIGPQPSDYVDGVARPASERRSPLPFGFAFENPRSSSRCRPRRPRSTTGGCWPGASSRTRVCSSPSCEPSTRRRTGRRDRPGFGSPGAMDRVFFSCAACHVGRVMVSGKMKFLPGMPNTEIEAQYYSKLLMLTGAALVESGFDPASTTPGESGQHQAQYQRGPGPVHARCWTRRVSGRKRYTGRRRRRSRAAKMQTLAVADEFPSVMQDLIAVGVKTHFIYHVVAKNNAYKAPLPDVLEDRPGQMDAFGIASGLVAIHTRRPDNSFLEFVRRDNPNSPIFTGFSKANGLPVDMPGMTEPVTDAKAAADRIFKNIPAWAPPVPAPIDVKSVNWATDRYHANWDGNQGASSRTLASGASATGDPRMVNVRIHEPLNPFIDNLPPPPYPFASVDLARAREGKAHLQGELRRLPHAAQSDDLSGVEAGRGSEPHDGEHQRVSLRAGRARDGSLPNLRPEQPGPAGRRLVRAERRLAGAARRVLPRHAAPCGGGHQRLQGRHAARHLGAGAVSAQRIGADARPAGVPGDAPAAIPPRQSPLRRSAGRLRMGRPAEGPIQPPRHDSDQGVRHDGAGQGQHRPHLRRRPVSGYERPRSQSRIGRRLKTAASARASGRCSRT